MKKILLFLFSALLLSALCLLPACKKEPPQEPAGTTAADETDGGPRTSPDGTGSDAQAAPTETPETRAPETETPETEAPETQAPETDPPETDPGERDGGASGQEILGTSANGFLIERIDGITYVGGILIANKTYPLPRDYAPGDLTEETEDAFYEMKEAAAADGISLWIVSGYRSYELQNSLYERYAANDGYAAADRYSARPGHSEHQTGLAMDLNDVSSSFADTAAGRWIAENCWRYGFILRYGKGKESETGYMYEPWHVRYLGKSLAAEVYNSGESLESYLGITSEYE